MKYTLLMKYYIIHKCIFSERQWMRMTAALKICRLKLNLLLHQDDNLSTDHSEVVISSTNNAQCVLHHGVVQQLHQHFITPIWFSIARNAICGCGTFLPSAMFLEIH